MAIEYFCCYHSYLEAMEPLTDAEKGRLFTAMLVYSKTGEVPQLSGNERFIFPMMRGQIDRDNQRYDAKRKKQAENARMRWHDKAESESHGMPPDANACQTMPPDANDAKEKAKAEANLASIEKKLANEAFVSRAPEAVVNAEREKAEKAKALIAKLEESAAAMKA